MTECAHDCRIIVLFDTGLNWFPVTQLQLTAIAMHQGCSDYCLSNTGIGSGNKNAANHAITPAFCSRASARAILNSSSMRSSRFTFIERRSRQVPGATEGGRT